MNEIDENVIGETLTAKQEAFCQFYTQISTLFGNATLAYAEAYGFDLDNASHDDAIWLLKDGREVPKELYEELTSEETKGAKKIKDCTYDRDRNTCAVNASRLLRNAKIDKRIRALLNELMTTEVVDARLVEIIMKGEDKDSIQAIKEYNKLKQRIIDKKDITSGGEKIGGFNFVRADQPVPSDAVVTDKDHKSLLPEPNIVKP